MGRPAIYHVAMTPAERMRRSRARKREPEPKREGLAAVIRTRADFAHYGNISDRQAAYLHAFRRDQLIEWDGAVLDGKHGKVGLAFLAEVCRLGDATVQQAIHDDIKKHGAAHGRTLWRMIKAVHAADGVTP